MLKVTELPKIPPYEVLFVEGGEPQKYDPMVLGYQLRMLGGEKDPEIIRTIVAEVFKSPGLDTMTACAILDDFMKFMKEHAEEPLKKVFGRGFLSDTTLVSPEKNTKS